MRSKRNKKIIKNFTDYLVPIVIVGVIFIIILSFIFSKEKDTRQLEQVSNSVNLNLGSQDTVAYIEYSGGRKSEVLNDALFLPGESLSVNSGKVDLVFSDSDITMSLNRLGEIKYDKDTKNINLISSDLWINNPGNNLTIDMRFAQINSNSSGVFSLSQNEVSSSLYVLNGNVEISNLSGQKTLVGTGKRVTIMRSDSNNPDLDIASYIFDIDNMTKNDDWFVSNNADFYLNKSTNSENSLSITGSSLSSDKYSLISFTSIKDEAEISTGTINITGEILDDIVSRIEFSGKQAEINTLDSTFKIENFNLPNRVNDLVYRVYDSRDNIIYKGIITIYNTGGTSQNSSSGLASVEHYSLDVSDEYKFLLPSSNPYITTDEVVTIEGQVPTGIVSRIVVNNFQLTAFPRGGSNWRYHANSQYGNLKKGLNIYNVKYYSTDDKLIYENNFVIIKE